MNTDPYLATKDIEVRKRLVVEHMRAHLTPDNLGYTMYRTIFKPWGNRASSTFGSWNAAAIAAFGQDALDYWTEQYKNFWRSNINKQNAAGNHIKNKHKKFEDKIDIKNKFLKGYHQTKTQFGYFNCKLYKKANLNLEYPSMATIERAFGNFKIFYREIINDHPEIDFDVIPPYNEDDFRRSLNRIYKKYGFVSYFALMNEKGCVNPQSVRKQYGNLEKACEYFGIPYERRSNKSKLFKEAEKRIYDILSLSYTTEKTFPWLKYHKLLQIDMFIPFFNLAIEIDGEQHYKKRSYYNQHRHDDFKTIQKRDKIKDIELPKHNITLIRIKQNEVKKIPIILKPYVELLKTIQEYCAY